MPEIPESAGAHAARVKVTAKSQACQLLTAINQSSIVAGEALAFEIFRRARKGRGSESFAW
ncbi:hypothetical protein CQ017_14045 [Arthrobacter sp. MYb224]|nr:hypothetical protein CQ017_14045 [Arthrobacter sp. MYb224]PRA00841.1 hypothetical protein CQ019_14995 [Arthrobacter sp. MYb229]PRB48775.1 hypothetical protein CQ013_14400 [Arthrobacter sp. MYb216]